MGHAVDEHVAEDAAGRHAAVERIGTTGAATTRGVR